jgi:hypothetical protein
VLFTVLAAQAALFQELLRVVTGTAEADVLAIPVTTVAVVLVTIADRANIFAMVPVVDTVLCGLVQMPPHKQFAVIF